MKSATVWSDSLAGAAVPHVPESRFGLWFLATDTWAVHVLDRCLRDLERLMANRRKSYPVVVDVGCGFGRSFKLLRDRFAPQRLIGVDIEPEILAAASDQAARDGVPVEIMRAASTALPIDDETADLVLCHQTLHHLVDQEGTLREIHRILKPGGLLLVGESTRAYIHSWIIRLLFRHPMHVQRTAEQYLAMIRAAGFAIDDRAVSYPYLWWSRSDLGLGERLLGVAPPAVREETLVNLVAVRA